MKPSPAHVQRMDQKKASFRDTAEVLAVFHNELVEAGLSDGLADNLTDTYFAVCMESHVST